MKLFWNKIFLTLLSTISTIIIVILLIWNIIISANINNIAMIIVYLLLIIFSFFIYASIQILFWWKRYVKTIDLVNSINLIDSSQEEIFKIGSLIYDKNLIITFITPFLQKEGFENFLGKKISSLEINLEKITKQVLEKGSHKWEVFVFKKNRTILLKDVTENITLINIIESQLKSVLSIHTSFSKKINFNDSIKADITLKINQTIKEWVTKIGGLLNSSLSAEGTVSAIFNWKFGEKDIQSQKILDLIKKANYKLSKDITISIGVAYGNLDYVELLDLSLRSLEISKNRGGDQIVLSKPNGEMEYIGLSKQQAVSGAVLNIKRFYLELIEDIQKAKEVFITSHKMADLDSIGAAMGLKQLINKLNNNVYIILNEFDNTTLKFYNKLPEFIKDWFIDEEKAKTLLTNRSHFIITDTSNFSLTQAFNILQDFDSKRITIIDHHRMSKGKFEYNPSKTLIETTISSASELVTEMLKITFGNDGQSRLDKYVMTALLAGIKLDSKQLVKNVTNSTFESVAFLLNHNANNLEIEELFKLPQSLMVIEGQAFSNIVKPIKGIIFSFINEDTTTSEEQTSILADKLLEYEGINATFVVGKIENGNIKMSARSNGKINVQYFAEKLGGGGHFNIAACVWSNDNDYLIIKDKIIDEIVKLNYND